jgi:hypothetical protein
MFLLINDQKKHGQTIQRPKETWTDNTTTKGNILTLVLSEKQILNETKNHNPANVIKTNIKREKFLIKKTKHIDANFFPRI